MNATFDEALHSAYGSVGTEHLRAGVYAAMGAAHSPEPPDASQFPILGFYLASVTEDVFLVYVLTPGRFIRYEAGGESESLTIVVPAHRVSRVVERTAPNSVTVMVELDADAGTTVEEYRESTDPTDPAVLVGRSAGKVTRTYYEMTATSAAEGRVLMAFALALRNTVGT